MNDNNQPRSISPDSFDSHPSSPAPKRQRTSESTTTDSPSDTQQDNPPTQNPDNALAASSNLPPPAPPQINTTSPVYLDPNTMIKVGDIVDVDNKNRGKVTAISNNSSAFKYTIKYLIGNGVEYAVSKFRLKKSSIRDGTTTRSGNNRHSQFNPAQPRTIVQESEDSKKFKKALNDSFSTKKYNSSNPLYQFLYHNKNRAKGWLRQIIQNKHVNPKTNLNSKERQVLTIIKALFSGYSPQGQGNPLIGYQSLICQAFGIHNNTANNILTYFTDKSYSMERKTHSSKNKSVFNDETIRKKTYTAYNLYKRRKTAEFRDSVQRLPESEYQSGFASLPDDQKESYEVLAQEYLERSRFLWEDLKALLLKTKGKVSYCELEQQLGGIVNYCSIANFLKTQDGYRIRKDRILPHLDSSAKKRRVRWAKNWWCFWKAAASIPTEDAIVVNVHMDEKWFYAVRSRSNCKELTSIGLEGNNYHVQHKNHIGKELYVVVTAFVPPSQSSRPANVLAHWTVSDDANQ